jgi:signal transduction histidine kinase
MSLDNPQSQSALSMLGKPGQAAARFGELPSQESWAVLGIGLNDFQPLVGIYGPAWQRQVLELVAKLLLSGQETFGSPGDLLARLTGETFLVITQASNASPWEVELRRAFREGVVAALPPDHLCDGMICPFAALRLPMPSLAVGVVTDQDGPFANPRDLLDKVTKARNQNERPALLFDLNSLTVTANRLREEIQVARYAPTLLPLIERFTTMTTGPIHDLRNGLNVLYEEARRMISEGIPDPTLGETLITAARCSRFLLETCSEIRFRGVGSPHKVDLSGLLINNRPIWTRKLHADVTVDTSPEPVEIYADLSQVAQALFNLLSWLTGREEVREKISVTYRNGADQGEVVISGDFDAAVDEQGLVEYSLAELQSAHRPSLYVFQKLVARYGGSVQFQPGQIVLRFPKYHWQDVRSADVLFEQIRSLRSEVEGLRTHLGTVLPNRDQLSTDFPLRDVIGLASRVIADLVGEFGWIRQQAERQRQEADESQRASWESLEASSHFCQLLGANLLALEGGHALSPEATDVVEVLESVRRMLRSRIEGIAEFEWNVEAELPPVRATETALAQVVLNLALNSLEELARARPPVSRLSFAAWQIEDTVQIDISDTGGGLPAEVMEQLFEETVSTHQHVEGGIGLRVVKSILDGLGGEIEFRSAVGEGTTATITVPTWKGDR